LNLVTFSKHLARRLTFEYVELVLNACLPVLRNISPIEVILHRNELLLAICGNKCKHNLKRTTVIGLPLLIPVHRLFTL